MKVNQAASPVMEMIAFEKVTVQEARNAIRDNRAAYQKNWSSERLPGNPELLCDATRAWLRELPAAVRPFELVNRFPRIANKLARLSHRPAEMQHAMSELLIVRRGDSIRQGFPVRIVRELATLGSFYAALHPAIDVALAWS